MRAALAECYDNLAEHYHLIFQDWDRSIESQAGVLGPIIESGCGPAPLTILDCACGIGTQAIGLAQRGHIVTASDASAAAVARATREAAQRGLTIDFTVADMRDLSAVGTTQFDAVVIADNALPHMLDAADLAQALRSIAAKLKPGGMLLVTMRDYDTLIQTRPQSQQPVFFSDNGRRRIMHQVWDWDGDQYTFHLYLTYETGAGWKSHHFVSRYKALQRAELFTALDVEGFAGVQHLEPAESGFYQPIVIARKKA